MDVKELKNYIYENRYVEQILESIGCHHIKYHASNAYWTCANANGDSNGAIVLYNNEYLMCLNYTRQMIKGDRKTDIVDLVCYTKDLTFPEGLKFICEEIGMSYYHDFDEESNRYTIPIRSEIGDLVGVKGRYFDRKVPEGENKYIYLEPCAKSKILYGLYKTAEYAKNKNCIYVLEAEKSVLQLWNYGYRNSTSTGGKELSQYQIDMIVRLGVDIILAMDKDVKKDEIEQIANRFPDGVPIYYIYDEDEILEEKESPSDNPQKWSQLIKNNIYRIR